MTKLIILIPAVFGIFLSMQVLAVPSVTDAKREIQAVLFKSDESLHRKDIQGCIAGFTQDFEGEDISGDRYNREQAKQNLVKSLSNAQSINAKTTVESISFVYGRALVVSQEHTALTVLGKRTHHLHTLIFAGVWQSIWINTKAGWCEKYEKQLSSTVTRDGITKVIPATKPK